MDLGVLEEVMEGDSLSCMSSLPFIEVDCLNNCWLSSRLASLCNYCWLTLWLTLVRNYCWSSVIAGITLQLCCHYFHMRDSSFLINVVGQRFSLCLRVMVDGAVGHGKFTFVLPLFVDTVHLRLDPDCPSWLSIAVGLVELLELTDARVKNP